MIKKSIVLSLSLVMLILSSCNSGGRPEIVVRDATVIPSGMMKGVASSFMQIINSGSGSDKLTGCTMKEYPSARGELHDFKDGRMTKVEEVIIPAHETTELMRGSLHIKFFKIFIWMPCRYVGSYIKISSYYLTQLISTPKN